MSLPHSELAALWSKARPEPIRTHLDHAACSRPSVAVLEAVAAHALTEGQIGAYVAEDAAAPILQAGRAALAALFGLGPGDVAWSDSAQSAMDRLLSCWPGLTSGGTVAVSRQEYGPTVAWLVDHGIDVVDLPDLPDGTTDLDALPGFLDVTSPALVVLSHLASQRGLAQPAREIVHAAHAAGVPVIVDAAQSLGHLRCDDVGADAWVATSRKWLAGPRGVGVLALSPATAARFELRAPSLTSRWQPGDDSVVARLGSSEAHIAGRIGLSLAAAEHLAAGPERIRERLQALGNAAAEQLSVAGWRPAPGQSGAIVSMLPPAGVDVGDVRRRLLTEHHVITTKAGVERAPRDSTPACLRFSPHVDTDEEDLERAARALSAAT